jgi:ATP-dependent Clp protease ATP-binding subunit ClpX
MGFGATVRDKDDTTHKDIFNKVEPDDLIKFGLIPEIVGRLPILAPLEGLTKEDLARILVEPKNAITKQYQRLFALDKIDLIFEEDAVKEISKLAIDRKTGARGLRAITENILLDAMFEIPSQKNVKAIHINKKSINDSKAIKIDFLSDKEAAERDDKKAISVISKKEKVA